MTHKDCELKKGGQAFHCNGCGEYKMNFRDGVELCSNCCEKLNICQICGKSMVEPLRQND